MIGCVCLIDWRSWWVDMCEKEKWIRCACDVVCVRNSTYIVYVWMHMYVCAWVGVCVREWWSVIAACTWLIDWIDEKASLPFIFRCRWTPNKPACKALYHLIFALFRSHLLISYAPLAGGKTLTDDCAASLNICHSLLLDISQPVRFSHACQHQIIS